VTTAGWVNAWTAALDALDADVAAVEALLVSDHGQRDHPVVDPWSPPEGLGPLPIDLRPRADAVFQRQLAAARAITLALATNRRQANAVARIESGGQGAPVPAYVDCAM
jgi:hypothetical protein